MNLDNLKFDVEARFLRYVVIDTQSDPESPTCPSTEKQKDLGRLLVNELLEIGVTDAHLDAHALGRHLHHRRPIPLELIPHGPQPPLSPLHPELVGWHQIRRCLVERPESASVQPVLHAGERLDLVDDHVAVEVRNGRGLLARRPYHLHLSRGHLGMGQGARDHVSAGFGAEVRGVAVAIGPARPAVLVGALITIRRFRMSAPKAENGFVATGIVSWIAVGRNNP